MKLIKNILPMWRITLAVILNLVVVFNLCSSALHDQFHIHQSNEIACTETNEADACHQYVIHHKKSQQCDGSHKHFVLKHDDCFVCDYYQENHFLEYKPYSTTATFTASVKFSFASINQNYSFDILLCYSLRGPPAIA